jgi:hypothetical protein
MSFRKPYAALWVIGLAALSLVLLVSLFSQPDAEPESGHLTLTAADCSLALHACELEIDSQAVRFELDPPGLPAMQTLTLRIEAAAEVLENLRIKGLWFEGHDMDMGNHYLLPDASAAGKVFKGVIPMCSADPSMLWQLVAELEYRSQSYRLVFLLERSPSSL